MTRRLRSATRADTHEDIDFGIVTAKVDEIGYIAHAENLGYRADQIMLYPPLNRQYRVIEDFAEQVMVRV